MIKIRAQVQQNPFRFVLWNVLHCFYLSFVSLVSGYLDRVVALGRLCLFWSGGVGQAGQELRGKCPLLEASSPSSLSPCPSHAHGMLASAQKHVCDPSLCTTQSPEQIINKKVREWEGEQREWKKAVIIFIVVFTTICAISYLKLQKYSDDKEWRVLQFSTICACVRSLCRDEAVDTACLCWHCAARVCL